MNINSKFVGLFLVVIGWMLAGQNGRADIVYNNTSNREVPALFGQTTGYEMGDEVVLGGGTARDLTNFVFEYFGTGFGGGEQARLRIYRNDGDFYGTNNNGSSFYAPGTVLFDSGFFSIGNTPGSTLAFSGADFGSGHVVVPTNFTWTVEFSGIGAGENAGLTLFQPPSLGFSFPDYWESTNGVWALNSTNATYTNALNFGAYVEAAVTTAETNRPTVKIENPSAANKFRSLTNMLTVNGSAKDDQGVALILYRVGSPIYGTNNFVPATGSTLWTNTITLRPGTNIFQVKSVDLAGNDSLVTYRTYSYVVSNNLTVITLNIGTEKFNPTDAPLATPVAIVPLEINRDYSLTATPGVNHIFSNWLSSISVGTTNVATSNTKITFNMKTNMVLVADFETNRFIAAAGSYQGLFTDEATPVVSFERSGLFTLKTDSKQKFSGKAYIDGKTVGFSGLLNLEGYGVSKKPAARKGKASLWATVQLALDGSDGVSGTVYTTSNAPAPGALYGGTFTSVLTGFKAIVMTNTATNLLGNYTLVVDVPTNTLAPRGNGYGTITMKADGKVKLAGLMGDYAKFKTVVVPISKDGDWPLYASTYKGIVNYTDKNNLPAVSKENSGMIMGWMKFTNNTDYAGSPATNATGRELLDGSVSWVKIPNTNNFYVVGFTNHYTPVLGSVYNAPADPKTTRILDSFDGALGFGTVATWEGDLLTPFTNSIFMATNNKVSILGLNVNTQKVSIAYKNGLIKNAFSHPEDPVNTKKKGQGVVLQDEQVGYGVFKGTNDSGSFRLISN